MNKLETVQRELLQYYPKSLILKTGGLLNRPEKNLQHFLHFSPNKESAGVIRLGVFGDSFAFGSEVDKNASYPFYLQHLFNSHFSKQKVEVLNFGIELASFQEQFFLWEEYAKKYNLDYVLFGPLCVLSVKDLTFRKNYILNRPPKDRFILGANNKLKLVQVKGEALIEKSRNYYSLIPPLVALLYDKRPFQKWESILPCLKDSISNPFYYNKRTEEAVKINTILLKKMNAKHNQKILVFTINKNIYNQYKSALSFCNLNLVDFLKNGFYKRLYHNSSLGNELIAKVYFNALIGKRKFSLNFIKTIFQNIEYLRKNFQRDLYSVKSIFILAEDIPVFSLRKNYIFHHYYDGSYYNNRIKGVKSFIAFSHKNSLENLLFIPVFFSLKDGMKVYIEMPNKEKIEWDAIRSLDGYNQFYVFYGGFEQNISDSFHRYLHKHCESFIYYDKIPRRLFMGKEKIKKFNLFIEDHKIGILKLTKYENKKILKLIPINGYEKTFLMTGPVNFIEEKNLPEEFSLYIQYNMINGDKFKSLIPNWKCKKEKIQIQLDMSNLKPLI